MIKEMISELHRMVTNSVRKGEMKLADVKDLASETTATLIERLSDPSLTPAEKRRVLNAVVAISKVESDLDDYQR